MQKYYKWSCLDKQGKHCTGESAANNTATLLQQLTQQQLTPTTIKLSKCQTAKHIKRMQAADFCEQLGGYLHFNIELTTALESLIKTSKHIAYIQAIKTVLSHVKQGSSLSDALEKSHLPLAKSHLSIIHAGEKTGQLATMLQFTADLLKKQIQLKSKLLRALHYPITLLAVTLFIVGMMLTFVLPNFTDIFSSSHAQLPWLTRVLIQASDKCQILMPWLFTFTGMFLIGLKMSPTFKNRMQKSLTSTLAHLPLLKQLQIQQALFIWSHVLAACLQAGLPMLEALQIGDLTLNVTQLKRTHQQVKTDIQRGASVYSSLATRHFLSEHALQLIYSAEQSGQLGSALLQISQDIQNHLDEQLARLAALLEPISIILVSVIVATLLAAMYLPILKMGAVM